MFSANRKCLTVKFKWTASSDSIGYHQMVSLRSSKNGKFRSKNNFCDLQLNSEARKKCEHNLCDVLLADFCWQQNKRKREKFINFVIEFSCFSFSSALNFSFCEVSFCQSQKIQNFSNFKIKLSSIFPKTLISNEKRDLTSKLFLLLIVRKLFFVLRQ